MSDDRFQMRAQDYKSSWANALSVDLQQNAELTRLMAILSDELDDQRAAVLDIVMLFPQLLISVEDRLSDTTNKLVASINDSGHKVQGELKATGSELLRNQDLFLKEFEIQRNELTQARATLDIQRADIEKARLSLEEARAGFNQMGLFKRIFIRR